MIGDSVAGRVKNDLIRLPLKIGQRPQRLRPLDRVRVQWIPVAYHNIRLLPQPVRNRRAVCPLRETCPRAMRLNEVADKKTGNLPAAGDDAVNHHIQPNLARHLLSHVAQIPHTAINERHLAHILLRRLPALDIALSPRGRKTMEMKDGGEARPRHDQLCAAPKTGRAVRKDTPHTDLELGLSHNAVDIDRRPVLQTAVGDKIARHEVMRSRPVGRRHLRANLLHHLLVRKRPVRAAANHNHRLAPGNASLSQLLKHVRQHLRRRRRPAQIIDNDRGTGPSPCCIADAQFAPN